MASPSTSPETQVRRAAVTALLVLPRLAGTAESRLVGGKEPSSATVVEEKGVDLNIFCAGPLTGVCWISQTYVEHVNAVHVEASGSFFSCGEWHMVHMMAL